MRIKPSNLDNYIYSSIFTRILSPAPSSFCLPRRSYTLTKPSPSAPTSWVSNPFRNLPSLIMQPQCYLPFHAHLGSLYCTDMCEQLCHQYMRCGHLSARDYSKCAVALARPQQTICVPASGSIRDLPRALDAQDRNIAGFCPACWATQGLLSYVWSDLAES